MKTSLPNIFEYIDFRKYLDDYRQARVSIDPGFTHVYICYRLGIKNSRGYFNNIVKGRKNIGPESVGKLSQLLELKSDESDYFRALVNYRQTKIVAEKEYYFNQIVSLNRTPKSLIDKRTFAYFQKWYNVPLRELLDIHSISGKKTDYKKLAVLLDPKITASEAKGAVELLQSLGLVKKDHDGYLKPTDKVITTGDKIKSDIIDQYQLKALDRAKEKCIAGST